MAQDRKAKNLEDHYRQFTAQQLERIQAVPMDKWEPYFGAAEAINGKIMVTKRRACGCRNKEHFKTVIYFFCGGLDLHPL